MSPDGRWLAFRRNEELWVHVLVTGLEASTTELQELVQELEEDCRERRGDWRQRRQ